MDLCSLSRYHLQPPLLPEKPTCCKTLNTKVTNLVGTTKSRLLRVAPHLVVADLGRVHFFRGNRDRYPVDLGEGAVVVEEPNSGGQVGNESSAFNLKTEGQFSVMHNEVHDRRHRL